MSSDEAEYSDVLIVGAGISGIGAAYRIHEKNPGLSYTVLERRERIGGTWDLIRYPGIRSDSDIFTLSFPCEPWTRPENVADGRRYPGVPDRDGPQARHRRAHPVQHARVISADWDSATDTWTVQTESDGAAEGLPGPLPVLRHRLLQLRRAVPARLSRPRTVHRRRGASPVLAGVAGLQRQAYRRDRQRRNSDQHDPVAFGDGRPRDDAAAFAVLHHVDAAHPSRGPGDPEGAAQARR